MKWIIATIVAGIAAHAIGGDDSQVDRWRKEAVAQFPDLGDTNSLFNKRFLARVKALKSAGDFIMTGDD